MAYAPSGAPKASAIFKAIEGKKATAPMIVAIIIVKKIEFK
jgi:hypothetical protein